MYYWKIRARSKQETNPRGHLFPDTGLGDTRSKSWNTRLLAPTAFITKVDNPDSPYSADPTVGKRWLNAVKKI